jgi:hypothetical protein
MRKHKAKHLKAIGDFVLKVVIQGLYPFSKFSFTGLNFLKTTLLKTRRRLGLIEIKFFGNRPFIHKGTFYQGKVSKGSSQLFPFPSFKLNF